MNLKRLNDIQLKAFKVITNLCQNDPKHRQLIVKRFDYHTYRKLFTV